MAGRMRTSRKRSKKTGKRAKYNLFDVDVKEHRKRDKDALWQ